jgi:hypothetical protein
MYCPLFLSFFNQKWKEVTNFNRIPQYPISRYAFQWVSSRYMLIERQMWRKYIGFEVLIPVFMKTSFFWDITQCSPLIILVLLATYYPEDGRRHVPPKCQLTFNGLHDITSQKTDFFMTKIICAFLKIFFLNLEETMSCTFWGFHCRDCSTCGLLGDDTVDIDFNPEYGGNVSSETCSPPKAPYSVIIEDKKWNNIFFNMGHAVA